MHALYSLACRTVLPAAIMAAGPGIAPALAQTTPTPDQILAAHILRRATFGPTVDDLITLTANPPTSIDNWFADQLDPFVQIPDNDPVYLGLLLDIGDGVLGVQDLPLAAPDLTVNNLARDNVARALFSERQLLEKMTFFWEQHFNTGYFSVRSKAGSFLSGAPETADQLATYFEREENKGIRANALGLFRNLLGVSAKGSAMVLYLDNYNSVASAPNENYARELMELHTLGTNPQTGSPNLYTEQDIDEAARIFTGWSVKTTSPYDFDFVDTNHDSGNKTLFGGALQITGISGPNGFMEGDQLLDFLAVHPVTAEFVCGKLYNYFINEGIYADPLKTDLINEWVNTGGDIKAVLTKLFDSPEFSRGDNHWTLVETPLESLASAVRGYDGSASQSSELDTIMNVLELDLDQQLFRFPSPDGYPIASLEQVSTAGYLHRMNFVQTIFNGVNSWQPPLNYIGEIKYDLPTFMLGLGVDLGSETSVLDFLFLLNFQDYFVNPQDYGFGVDFISRNTDGTPGDTFSNLLNSGQGALFTVLVQRIAQTATLLASVPMSYQK